MKIAHCHCCYAVTLSHTGVHLGNNRVVVLLVVDLERSSDKESMWTEHKLINVHRFVNGRLRRLIDKGY